MKRMAAAVATLFLAGTLCAAAAEPEASAKAETVARA